MWGPMSRTCTTSRTVTSSAETDSENITSRGTESGTLDEPLLSNTVDEKKSITSYVASETAEILWTMKALPTHNYGTQVMT